VNDEYREISYSVLMNNGRLHCPTELEGKAGKSGNMFFTEESILNYVMPAS
jgi:hypothetical protein